MNEPGTPAETATASKATRIERLLGPGFSVFIEWKGHPLRWYEITACKEKTKQYANWTMIDADFDYNDAELLVKFINPAKGVFK